MGLETRSTRLDRGLSLAEAGKAMGRSGSWVSRAERGLSTTVTVVELARFCAVLGLDLSLRTYPGGAPVRDAAHIALLASFRAHLHASLGWAAEVPLPGAGDSRAWDGLVRGSGWRYGVEAETKPRDVQAVVRRLLLKVRDGAVDGVFLVLPDTRHVRAFLQEFTAVAGASFPVTGRRARELLRAGVDPGGNAVIVLPRRQSFARPAR
jgi:transcriptional regulator with XRE-family HTH domain